MKLDRCSQQMCSLLHPGYGNCNAFFYFWASCRQGREFWNWIHYQVGRCFIVLWHVFMLPSNSFLIRYWQEERIPWVPNCTIIYYLYVVVERLCAQHVLFGYDTISWRSEEGSSRDRFCSWIRETPRICWLCSSSLLKGTVHLTFEDSHGTQCCFFSSVSWRKYYGGIL
jgi:hypothetical protein